MTNPYLPDPMITLGDDGTPRSGISGDIYFSTSGGIEETRHVFLGGIGAPEIWRQQVPCRIAELGFGTGLNFLVTWQAWKNTTPAGAQLDYLAIEGFPIEQQQLAAIYADVPELAAEADALLASLPPRIGGPHRLLFDGGRVRLTLMYGDVGEMLAAMTGTIDAWYLDGFAPSKNPAMWSEDVLAAIARLSAPGARLATFSAAGAVRRGLEVEGFAVEKRQGFGRKRDCISAVMTAGCPRGAGLARGARVAVVGSGIAGGCMVRSLAARGMSVTLVDAVAEPGAGASGNPAALIAPRLPRVRVPFGRIMASAYHYAIRFYEALQAEGAPVWLGARGAFTMARNDDEEQRQVRSITAFGWPDSIMRRIDADEATALLGTPVAKGGVWFAEAGTLSPPAITRHLASEADVLTASVGDLVRTDQGWLVMDQAGQRVGCFDAVVVCAGIGIMQLMRARHWPLVANRGQLAYLPPIIGAPTVPVSYGGYLSPPISFADGSTGHVLGATYAGQDEMPPDGWQDLNDDDTRGLIDMLRDNLPSLDVAPPVGGRTALRATIRDYMPLAGCIEEGLYSLGALGSRGFLTAPLLAELVADQMIDAPQPLEADLVRLLDPRRFNKTDKQSNASS